MRADAPKANLSVGDRPLYVNSITIGKDGTVYSLGRVTEGGKTRADLFSVPNPLK